MIEFVASSVFGVALVLLIIMALVTKPND